MDEFPCVKNIKQQSFKLKNEWKLLALSQSIKLKRTERYTQSTGINEWINKYNSTGAGDGMASFMTFIELYIT